MIAIIAGTAIAGSAVAAKVLEKEANKTTYKAETVDPIPVRKMGFYEKHIKRVLDIACATGAIVVFSPLYAGIALLVRTKLGSPVFFTQDRPGIVDKDGKETVFKMYKFRTMTDERDADGNLLPDGVRLTKTGAWLRRTSLDELPEAFNILNGTMSVIGPRPQLVRDLVFMSKEQRQRHTAKPGLSGLAQVNGRNAITWENKLGWDQKYIQKVTFLNDVRIMINTVRKAFFEKEGITEGDMATAEDYGDYLLREGKIEKTEYDSKQEAARKILHYSMSNREYNQTVVYEKDLVSIVMPSWNTAQYIGESIQSVLDQTYTNWELLIVDDCSTDNTDEVVKPYLKDTRIKYYKNEVNSGAAVTRNRAIRQAHGEWVAFLDSDDLWKPDKLQKQLDFMKEHGYIYSYHDYVKIDENDRPLNVYVSGPNKVTKRKMYNYCYPGCLTFMYNARAIGIIQIKDIKKNNDYAMHLKLCKKADCYLLKENLAEYRIRKKSISHDQLKKKLKSHYDLFHFCDEKPAPVALWYACWNMFYGILKKQKYEKKNWI